MREKTMREKTMRVEGLEKWGDSVIADELGNGNTLYYVAKDGTYFPMGIYLKDKEKLEVYNQVDEKLMDILNNSRKYGSRIRVWYGDRETGKSWLEEYGVTGRVGRSCGSIKIPLLINNKRSWGGEALLVGSIIRIDDIEERKTLWKVPNFHVREEMIIVPVNDEKYPYAVMQKDDGIVSNVANFTTIERAERWIAFQEGRRYCK